LGGALARVEDFATELDGTPGPDLLHHNGRADEHAARLSLRRMAGVSIISGTNHNIKFKLDAQNGQRRFKKTGSKTKTPLIARLPVKTCYNLLNNQKEPTCIK